MPLGQDLQPKVVENLGRPRRIVIFVDKEVEKLGGNTSALNSVYTHLPESRGRGE